MTRVLLLGICSTLMVQAASFATAPAPGSSEPPASAKIRKALDDVGDVTLENMSLTDLAAFFKNRMKVDVKIEPGIAALWDNTADGQGFNVKTVGQSYRKTLKAALEPKHLSFAIIGGTLFIGQEETLLARQLRQSVSVDANGITLTAVLKTLTDDSGANIVLDPRQQAAADAGKVTLKLDDVPLETAVRLVTEVGGLRTVRMNNVLFITNDARADKLRDEGLVAPVGNMSGFPGAFTLPPAAGAPIPLAIPPLAPNAPPPANPS